MIEGYDDFEEEINECLPKEAEEDFKCILKQLALNCENLSVLSMKIKRKGSEFYE